MSNANMKIGSNKDINKDHKSLLKMLVEKRNDEKLAITILIVGTGLIAYRFW